MNKIKLLVLSTMIVTCQNLEAQPVKPPDPHCGDLRQYINTGYDRANNSVLTAGNNDPKWIISNFNSDVDGDFTECIALPTPYYPAVVADISSTFWYSYATTDAWISYHKDTWPNIPNQNCEYSVFFMYPFSLCINEELHDNLRYDFIVHCDNWIKSVTICNTSITPTSGTIGSRTSNSSYYNDPNWDPNNHSSAFLHFSGTTPILAGQTGYALIIEVANVDGGPGSNPIGLEVEGYIESALGIHDIMQ